MGHRTQAVGYADVLLFLSAASFLSLVITQYDNLFAGARRTIDPHVPVAPKNDPPIGTSLEALEIHIPKGNKPSTVILLGDCQTCSASSLSPGSIRIDDAKFRKIAVVRNASSAQKEMWNKAGWAVIESSKATDRIVDSSWTPRFLVTDESGRIEWIQPQKGQMPSGVSLAK